MTLSFSFFFQKVLLKSSEAGTVLEINGLQVKLVIPSISHCLPMKEGACGSSFV